MIDELETMRHAAIMETVGVMQRAQDLFMAAHRQAQDCAVLAAKIAVLVYGLRKDDAQ